MTPRPRSDASGLVAALARRIREPLALLLLALSIWAPATPLLAQDAPAAPPAESVPPPAPAPDAVAPDAPPATSADSPAAPPAPPQPSPSVLLDAMKAKWDSIRQYTCILDTWTRRGTETSHKIIDFAFRKPSLVRNHVLEGDNKGSTVVRTADGKLLGKKGGVLGLVVLTLEDDDERIRNLRGVRFYNGTFGYVIDGFRQEMADGWTIEVLPPAKRDGVDCVRVQATAPPGKVPAGEADRDVIWIDEKTSLLKGRQQWVGKTKVSDTTYSKIVLEARIPDDAFDL